VSAVIVRAARGGDGEVAPPTHDDDTRYPYAMYYSGEKFLAYADTPGDLLGVLIEGYAEMDDTEQLSARIRLAIDAQVATQAQIVTSEEFEAAFRALGTAEQDLVLAPRHKQPVVAFWDSLVPLVLVETGYAPYTDLDKPISGISDVADPPNLYFLRPQEEWEFLVSLDRAGFVRVLETADL